MAQEYLERQNARFSQRPTDQAAAHLKQYWQYLTTRYGDHPKPIWEAFFPIGELFADRTLSLGMKSDEIERLRATPRRPQPVRYKAALFVYMEFLSTKKLIEPREERNYKGRFNGLVSELSSGHSSILGDYIAFCRQTRRLSNWTTYLAAHDVRDMFREFEASYGDFPISAVSSQDLTGYLKQLDIGPKTLYNTSVILYNFFRWAKMRHLVFQNPMLGAKVRCPMPRPEGLALDEQQRLLRRWLGDGAHPCESCIGVLSLFYGLSTKEICSLQVDHVDIPNRGLTVPKRPFPLTVTNDVVRVLQRYLGYRNRIVGARTCRFLFPSENSARFDLPMDPLVAVGRLKDAKVNLRRLRATLLIDLAMYGNVKLIETIGLSLDGTRSYIAIVEDSLAIQNIGDGQESMLLENR